MVNEKEKLLQSLEEYNRMLVSKIKQVDEEKMMLLSQVYDRDTPIDLDGPNYDDDYRESEHPNNECSESVNDLECNLAVTEELLGIKMEDFKCQNITSQNGLPPGMWREVSMKLALDQLNVAITFIENAERTVLFLKWLISGGSAPTELAPLSTIIKNDVPSLIIRLREYAQLNRDRMEILHDFYIKFKDFVNINSVENGVCVTWNVIFKMLWSLIPCENIGNIVNSFQINVYNEDMVLQSQAILDEFYDIDKTTEDPQGALMKLGEVAKQMFCS